MIILMNMIKEMKMITLNKIVKSEQIVIPGIIIVLLKRISSEKYDYGDRINCVFFDCTKIDDEKKKNIL